MCWVINKYYGHGKRTGPLKLSLGPDFQIKLFDQFATIAREPKVRRGNRITPERGRLVLADIDEG